jgi:hypothetical protein
VRPQAAAFKSPTAPEAEHIREKPGLLKAQLLSNAGIAIFLKAAASQPRSKGLL